MDVISEMLGVPEADRDEVRRLADLLVHREHGLRDVPAAGIEAAMTLFGYYADLLAEKRRQPADDLASALLAVEDGGDRMSDQEIIAFLFLMVVAGNETTTKLLGNAVFHLTADPRPARPGLRRPRRHRAGERVGRGDAALRHLDPAARPPARAGPLPARSHRSRGVEAGDPARRRQPRRARVHRPGAVRPRPRPERARPDASASAAGGTSASAPTWPGWRRGSCSRTLVRRVRSIEADHANGRAVLLGQRARLRAAAR